MKKFYLLKTLGDANDDSLVQIEDYVVGLEMYDWRVGSGERTADDWPSDATIVLRKTSGRKLTDMLGTIKNTLFVSPRFRAVLERHCAGIEIEYLPFELRDSRRRLIAKDYVIVNPVGTVDCLDLKASKILWDKKKPDKVLMVHEPVLSARKVERAPALFRIREAPTDLVISFDIAKDLKDGDFSNLAWEKLEVR